MGKEVSKRVNTFENCLNVKARTMRARVSQTNRGRKEGTIKKIV